jgi:hypothetical protein
MERIFTALSGTFPLPKCNTKLISKQQDEKFPSGAMVLTHRIQTASGKAGSGLTKRSPRAYGWLASRRTPIYFSG